MSGHGHFQAGFCFPFPTPSILQGCSITSLLLPVPLGIGLPPPGMAQHPEPRWGWGFKPWGYSTDLLGKWDLSPPRAGLPWKDSVCCCSQALCKTWALLLLA